jgi:cytidylate kinase
MVIAISGKSGCGNTSVSRIVADTLGLKHINYTFHNIADEQNIPFKEFHEMADKDTKWDIDLDKKQVELASRGNCVLGSRLAIWLLEDADLKVYLEGPLEVRASRIHKREGGSFEEVLHETNERDRKDHTRYLDLYGIDTNEYSFADLVVNVEDSDQYQVAERIVEEAEKTRC